MNSEIFGLGFNLTENGGYVLDLRGDKPKFIGIIMASPTGKGYTLCPYVRKSLEFSNRVPNNLKSPRKAQSWMLQHFVTWNYSRKYTVFNPIIGILTPIAKILHAIRNTQFQVIVLQFVLALLLICYHPFEIGFLPILTKVVGIILSLWALLNAMRYNKDPFEH